VIIFQKITAFFAISLLLVFLFSACSNGTGGGGRSTGTRTSGTKQKETVETDAYMQGNWSSLNTVGLNGWLPVIGINPNDITLFITPNEMTVYYQQQGKIVSTPFKIQFKRASGKDRFFNDKGKWADLSKTDAAVIYAKDFFKALNTSRINPNGTFAKNGFSWSKDADLIQLFEEILDLITPTANSFIVYGMLTVYDYQSATEIGTLPVAVISESNSFSANRGFVIFGISYANNVPNYMLNVPFRVGMYKQ